MHISSYFLPLFYPGEKGKICEIQAPANMGVARGNQTHVFIVDLRIYPIVIISKLKNILADHHS